MLFATYCNSQTKPPNTSKQADTLSEYQLIFWDSLSQSVQWVNDYEGLFTDEQEKILDSIIADFEQKTTIEICIVTFDTARIARENFEDFILQLHKAWGVGKKIKNNGIVIGISSGYRKMRISNGDGIEKLLDDSETKNIIDNDFIPFFRQANYYGGTLNGLKAIIAKLNEKIKD